MTRDTTGARTDATTTHSPQDASRRSVLLGVGGAAAGVTVLAGCGTSSAGSSTAGGGAGGSGTAASVPVSDVPVGGGTILQNPAVVVTQPTAGTYEAFSAICPHAGCPVTRIQGGLIQCPCHGSQFDITTGDVKAGPAPRGLTPLTATEQGGIITVS
jgi:Rieske Fe-S protein